MCQPLEAGSDTSCTNGSASCLSYNSQHFDLGRVTGGLQLSGEGELQLIYSGGTGCSKSAITVLTFRCDATAGVGEPVLSLHKNTSGSCYYDVVWDTQYACPITPTEMSDCVVTDPDTGTTISLIGGYSPEIIRRTLRCVLMKDIQVIYSIHEII